MRIPVERHVWVVWVVWGVGLLVADVVNAVLLTRSVGGALQQRAVVPQDVALAVLCSLSMSASQLWLFGRWAVRAPVVGERLVLVLVVPGALLNVVSNFFVIVGGSPSPDLVVRLQEVLVRSVQSGVGQAFLVIAGLLAVLVSFLPEFLIVRGWHERNRALHAT